MAPTVYRKDTGSYSIGGPYSIQCRDRDTGPRCRIQHAVTVPMFCRIGGPQIVGRIYH